MTQETSAAPARMARPGIAIGGRLKSGVETCVSIFLFGRSSPSPKLKKVCQPMKRRGAREPPREVVTIQLAELGRVEDETEERLAVIAREIRPIGGPDLLWPKR